MIERFLLSILIFLIAPMALATETHSTSLKGDWQYRWGDSPFADGIPLWTTEENQAVWRSIDFPSNPPDREGRNNIWYRKKLPDDPNLGNSIYVFSIDLVTEVYLDGKKIYQYGTFKPDGTADFVGWPWHIIDLPRDYPGKTIYFRIYSDYPDIGLWGEVTLGDEGELIQKIIQEDLLRSAVGLFFAFSGLLIFALALYRTSWPVFLMGFFMVQLGLESLHAGLVKQLILFAPLGWQYVGAASYFLIPATAAALIQTRYGAGKYKEIQWIALLHLVFLAYAMIFPLLGIINLSSTYIHFDLLAFFTLLFLNVRTIQEGRKGDFKAKLLAVGFSVFYLFLVFDGLTAHDLVPWLPQYNYLAQIVLAFCFGVILLREYNELRESLKTRSRELFELNQSLERRVEERTSELARLNQQKDRFFSILSHDLRSPLNGLLGLLGLLRMEVDITEEERETMLASVEDSGKNMARLLENLLEWARLQLDETAFHKVPLHLGELTDNVARLFKANCQAKNIALTHQLGECRVEADRHMLETVMRNLISNAIKYTQDARVTVTCEKDGNMIRISVEDEGTGMSEGVLEKIFLLEEKSSTPGTHQEQGTGLGLVLCKEFVERHGGKLWATSEKGMGSRFFFTLPQAG